jgi:hypothetical protein
LQSPGDKQNFNRGESNTSKFTSYADFSQTVDGLDSETLGPEAAKVQTEAEALDVTLALVSDALKCGK